MTTKLNFPNIDDLLSPSKKEETKPTENQTTIENNNKEIPSSSKYDNTNPNQPYRLTGEESTESTKSKTELTSSSLKSEWDTIPLEITVEENIPHNDSESPNTDNPNPMTPEPPDSDNLNNNNPAISQNSLWDIKPLDSFDEIPGEEYLHQQDTENSLKALLAPSNQLIDEIHQFLEKEQVPYVSETAEDIYCEKQSFTIEGKKYLLDDDTICQRVYQRVLNLNNQATMEHALKRRPNLLDKLKKTPPPTDLLKQNLLLSSFTPEIILRLVIRSLNFLLTNKLLKHVKNDLTKNITNDSDVTITDSDTELNNIEYKTNELNTEFLKRFQDKPEKLVSDLIFRKANIAQSLGEVMLDAFVTMNILNENITNATTAQRIMEELAQFNQENNTDEIISTARDPAVVMEILESLYNKTDAYKQHIAFTIDNTILGKKELAFRTAVIERLKMHYAEKTPPTKLPFNDNPTLSEKKKRDALIIDYFVNVGLLLITWLKNSGVFEETITAKKIPVLIYSKKHAIDLLAAGSFSKPPLSKKSFAEVFVEQTKNFNVSLNVKSSVIKQSKTVEITGTPKLKELLEAYKNMEFSVDAECLKFFLDTLEKAMLASNTVDLADDNFVITFLRGAFHIDFKLMLANNSNKALVYRLIKFGLDFNCAFDSDLQQSCNNNLAAINAYNKLSSHKFYIKGLLNDLNLYQHFKHFYIPHFITSTGRVFPLVYYLQFQGNKIVKLFITAKKRRAMSAVQIREHEQIIQKHFPEISRNAFLSNRFQDDIILLTNVKENTRGLFNIYVKSFIKPNVNLNEFNLLTDVQCQLEWLDNSVKKNKDIFYLFQLLKAASTNNLNHIIYEKDATGSGPQIISVLMRNPGLAIRTNVIVDLKNKEPQDLYMDFVNLTNEHIKNQSLDLVEFYLYILELNFFEAPKLKPGVLSKKQLVQAMLETPSEDTFNEYFTILRETNKDPLFIEKIHNFSFKTIEFDFEQSTKKKQDPLYRVLRYLNKLHGDYLLINKMPPEFLSRSMFKHAVMAAGYAQGSASRMDRFKENMEQHYIDLGYAAVPFTDLELAQFANFLNNSFLRIQKASLKPITYFLKYTERFVNYCFANDKDVTISIKYLTWRFKVIDEPSYRHRFMEGKQTHQFELFYSFGIDKAKMRSTFPSIFVQGLDAHIVHFLLDRINQINNELLAANLPPITDVFNHDCFGIAMYCGDKLVPMVQVAYNSLNDLHFPELKVLDKMYKPIRCNSTGVVKH